jgi:hypothetical protein
VPSCRRDKLSAHCRRRVAVTHASPRRERPRCTRRRSQKNYRGSSSRRDKPSARRGTQGLSYPSAAHALGPSWSPL